ncbi:hypothetical protein GOP47_0011763 [Adiantum capillus-veneris]|uniref:Uncharacterized protein n=1 Tax=Adiantum capillus-veneris TaxID=13818 RepID=A0A9D4ZHZ5_ADICA|nr:hypothetical protein GOP47_0011763 [Adiantum capillus-veneris]
MTELALPILLKNGQPINPSDPIFPLPPPLPLPSSTLSASSVPTLPSTATSTTSGADPTTLCKYRIQLDWSSADDEE